MDLNSKNKLNKDEKIISKGEKFIGLYTDIHIENLFFIHCILLNFPNKGGYL